MAGVSIAVSSASEQVLKAADLVTLTAGGRGAIREVCDAILESKGLTADLLNLYLASLKETSTDALPGQ